MNNNDHIPGEGPLPEDSFEKEAREGFDLLGESESKALKSATDLRFEQEVMKRGRDRRWLFAAAAAVLLLTFGILLFWLLPDRKQEVAVTETKAPETGLSTETFSPPPVETGSAEPTGNSGGAIKTVLPKQQPAQARKAEEENFKALTLATHDLPVEKNEDKKEMEAKEDLATDDFAEALPAPVAMNTLVVGSSAAKPLMTAPQANAKPQQYGYVTSGGATRSAANSEYLASDKSPVVISTCEYGPGSDSLHHRLQKLLSKNGLNMSFDASLTVNNRGRVVAAVVMIKPKQDAELAAKIKSLLLDLDGFYTVGSENQEKFQYTLQYRP